MDRSTLELALTAGAEREAKCSHLSWRASPYTQSSQVATGSPSKEGAIRRKGQKLCHQRTQTFGPARAESPGTAPPQAWTVASPNATVT